MRSAALASFSGIPGVETDAPMLQTETTVSDAAAAKRNPSWQDLFRESLARADAALVIAPETDGLLAALAAQVEASGVQNLGAPASAIRSAADKLGMAARIAPLGVPTVEATSWAASDGGFGSDSWTVLKPRVGAGCQSTWVGPARSAAERQRVLAALAATKDQQWIAQPYCEGEPGSIAAIRSPAGADVIFLPAVWQRITRVADASGVGGWWLSYAGGTGPVDEARQRRAEDLARAIIGQIPGLAGYFGIDLIWGRATDGSRDRVVEVNPRLTTSFVLYQHWFGSHVARRLLGATDPLPSRDPGPWWFTVDGGISKHDVPQ